MDHMQTKEPIGTVYVDTDRRLYKPLMSADWARETLALSKANPTIEEIILDFTMSWRSVSFTIAMPAEIVNMITGFADSFSNSHTPDTSIVALGQKAVSALSRGLPEICHDPDLVQKIRQRLIEILFRLRDVRTRQSNTRPIGCGTNLFKSRNFK